MSEPAPSLQEVMLLWSRGMNTADIARKFVCQECDVYFALRVGRELQRERRKVDEQAERLAEEVGRLADEMGANV